MSLVSARTSWMARMSTSRVASQSPMPLRNAARLPCVLMDATRRFEGMVSILTAASTAEPEQHPRDAARLVVRSRSRARSSSSRIRRASSSFASRSFSSCSGVRSRASMPLSAMLTAIHDAQMRMTWQMRLNQIRRPMITANDASSGFRLAPPRSAVPSTLSTPMATPPSSAPCRSCGRGIRTPERIR